MTNLIYFFNSFASYVVLAVLFVALGLIASSIGIYCRKKKDEKEATQLQE